MLRIQVEHFRQRGFPEDLWLSLLVKLPLMVALGLYEGGEAHHEASLAELRAPKEVISFGHSPYVLVVTIWTDDRRRQHYVNDDLATFIANRVKDHFSGEPFEDVTVGTYVFLVPAARGSSQRA